MKKIAIYLLFFSFVFASVQIEFDKEVVVPNTLKKNFLTYWKYRSKKQFDKIYSLELPYLQYLHTKEWYVNFFSQAPKFSKILVKKKQKCNDEVCILGILLFKNNFSEPVFYYDKWIKVDGKWYHKYNDSPLPVFR